MNSTVPLPEKKKQNALSLIKIELLWTALQIKPEQQFQNRKCSFTFTFSIHMFLSLKKDVTVVLITLFFDRTSPFKTAFFT